MPASQIRVFEIASETRVRPSSWEEMLAGLAADEATFYWVDIHASDTRAFSQLAEGLGVDAHSIENALAPDTPVGVVPKEGEVFIQLTLQQDWEQHHVQRMAVICLPRTVLTVHDSSIHLLEDFGDRLLRGFRLHAAQNSAVVYEVLDLLVDSVAACTLQARSRIDQLESLEQQDPETLRTRILSYRSNLSRFEIGAEYLRKCVASIQHLSTPVLDANALRNYYVDLTGHIDHALRLIERMEDRLSALHDHATLILQEKTNRRLNLLTFLSAIFMPLTLITGIYGMNFEWMPELHWWFGYPLVLVAMMAITAGMLGLFHWRGWFR